MPVNKLGFVDTLLAIIQCRCPACNSNRLYAPDTNPSEFSCASCDWKQTIEELKRLATGGNAVLRMRDEFLQLVNVNNAIGAYKGAQDAQAMAIALHRYEEQHDLTEVLWPAQIAGEEDHDKWLKRLEDLENESHDKVAS